MDDTGYASPFIQGRKKRFPIGKFILVLVVLSIIGVPLIVGGWYVAVSFSPKQVVPTPLPTSIAFPTDTPTPTPAPPSPTVSPTPTPTGKPAAIKTGLNKTTLNVIVENGSGRVGAANTAGQLLKKAGYAVTGIRNADAYDYVDVTISVKASKADYARLLKEDLEKEYSIVDISTTLSEEGPSDAIVIIGK